MPLLLPLVLAVTLLIQPQVPAAESDSRFYELRTYYAHPGKLDDLHARFRDHTCKIFAKHGMQNIGYWVPVDNTENKLVYLLAYPSRPARDKAWEAFGADPEWQSVYRESVRNGRLVAKVVSVFLETVDYSPDVQSSTAETPRVFELRTYQAAPAKLDALHARFRDHTLKLFSRHGMTHFGYWVPVEKKDGHGDTLIYMLAHQNQKARDESFAAFRADPAWIKAKSESEQDGSLTLKVDSLLLIPTDYSPTR